jgi:ATP-dependent Clp protease ATP-binding subunit ClpA
LRIELANAQRRGEFQRAGELAYGKIPELEKKLAEIEENEVPGEMMEEAVTANDIAQVVSRWTGVPPSTRCWRAKRTSSSRWRKRFPGASWARPRP